MFVAKNNDLAVMTADTREELLKKLTLMIYTSIEETDVEYVLYDDAYIPKTAVVAKREEDFGKEFFSTSLGYIRRKVSMSTGETKDFLSDLLPSISIGVQMGQPVSVITYSKPDFTQDTIDWESLQQVKSATSEFIRECFVQLNNDF